MSGLRLAAVPGVHPGRWVDTWRERYPALPIEVAPAAASEVESMLLTARCDVAFLRLPLTHSELARIPLWIDETVLALPREHELTLLDEVALTDLADETLLVPADNVLDWAEPPGRPREVSTSEHALELVGHEAGVALLPKAIALAHRRRDVVLRPLSTEAAAEVTQSQVALAWLPVDGDAPPLVADFIGIVRGRTANSSRGRAASRPSRQSR